MPPLRARRLRSLFALCLAVAVGACSDVPLPTDVAESADAVRAKWSPGEKPGNGGGGDGSGTMAEEFNALDPAVWEKRTKLNFRLFPENVSVSGGHLELATVPSLTILEGEHAGTHTFAGGAVRSLATFSPGVFEARIQASGARGSITAFFLYRENDEIDIEIIPHGSHPDRPGEDVPSVLFVTWENVSDPGADDPYKQTHKSHQLLDFDPAEDFHTYRIETKKNRVRFFIDGELRAQFTRNIPSTDMHVHLQARYPGWSWLPPGDPDETGQLARFDWVDF